MAVLPIGLVDLLRYGPDFADVRQQDHRGAPHREATKTVEEGADREAWLTTGSSSWTARTIARTAARLVG